MSGNDNFKSIVKVEFFELLYFGSKKYRLMKEDNFVIKLTPKIGIAPINPKDPDSYKTEYAFFKDAYELEEGHILVEVRLAKPNGEIAYWNSKKDMVFAPGMG